MRSNWWVMILGVVLFGGLARGSDETRLISVETSAQDESGRVWAVGRDEAYREVLARWENGHWRALVEGIAWPGSEGRKALANGGQMLGYSSHGPQSGVLALGDARGGEFWSWWEDNEQEIETGADGVERAKSEHRLYAYQHSGDEPARPTGAWRRGRTFPGRWNAEEDWRTLPIRRLIWAGGDTWALCSEAQRATGSALWRLTRYNEAGIAYPLPLPERCNYAAPRMATDARGRLWLWAESLGAKPSKERLFMVFDGERFDARPVIPGLPEEEITAFSVIDAGRAAVVAVRGEGLWTIDLETMSATRRDSPPAEQIGRGWFWQAWPDGLEVLLASGADETADEQHDKFWARVWLRDAQGWHERGGIRVETWGGGALRPMPMQELRWLRHDGHLVLTGTRRAWALSLVGKAEPRALDWRLGCETCNAGGAYAQADDHALIVAGRGPVAQSRWSLPRGALGEIMRRPLSMIHGVGEAVPGPAGEFWTREQTGPEAWSVRLWRAGEWRDWAVPAREDSWPELSVDGLGRAWLFSGADLPAWVLDPAKASAEWKRYDRLRDLVASEAVVGEKPISLRTVSGNRGVRLPVWSVKGEALVWIQDRRFDLWKGGVWHELPELPVEYPNRMGFDADGSAWVATAISLERARRWIWDDAGAWREGEEVTSDYAKREEAEAEAEQAPEWLVRELEPSRRRQMGLPVKDSSGAWWVFLVNERPLRARDGRVWTATRAEVPDPWRGGINYGAQRVVVLPGGTVQIWSYDSVIVVPAEALSEESQER